LLIGYAFASEKLGGYRRLVPYCMVGLLLAALLGLGSGTVLRMASEDAAADAAEQKAPAARALLHEERVLWEEEKARLLADVEVDKARRLVDVEVLRKNALEAGGTAGKR
jgi:hypothetical protein